VEWFGQILADNAPIVVLVCLVWYQLNARFSGIYDKLGRMRERLVRIETKIGVDDDDSES
jgi:hypothetical protein